MYALVFFIMLIPYFLFSVLNATTAATTTATPTATATSTTTTTTTTSIIAHHADTTTT